MGMERKQESFEEKLAFGKEGEHEVGEYFMQRSYCILPLYQFTDDIAPKIFTLSSTITSPDLFICGNNKYFWVEVKTKNRWIKYNGTLETGCNYRHYKEYCKISDETGMTLYLIFNHKKDDPTGFYYVDIKKRYHRIWDGKNIKTGKIISPEMALWLINDLTKIK